MALSASVLVEDLRTLLGLKTFDETRAELVIGLALERAQAVVDPVPDAGRAVVLDIAARAYSNPTDLQSDVAGPFTRTFRPGAGGVFVTKAQRAELRRLAGRGGGAFTVRPGPAEVPEP